MWVIVNYANWPYSENNRQIFSLLIVRRIPLPPVEEGEGTQDKTNLIRTAGCNPPAFDAGSAQAAPAVVGIVY